ncbi:hypothetical protein EKN94_13515 [Enterobacter quasimori]|uniref:Uncharacterized protein n=1 Tax=Enterobacter quasimori TaxID=2838947 RepID=A0ABY0ASE2_9ENTR|nr:hypothetical protein EKN94_13515 [Enterobacter quasimori]
MPVPAPAKAAPRGQGRTPREITRHLTLKRSTAGFFSSLMQTLVSWNERSTAQKHLDVIEFSTAEQ